MHITLDLSPAVHRHAGLGRYASELLTALMTTAPDNEYSAVYYAPLGTERPAPPLDQVPAQALRMGAKPWVARTELAWAEMLLARGGPNGGNGGHIETSGTALNTSLQFVGNPTATSAIVDARGVPVTNCALPPAEPSRRAPATARV